MILDRHFIVSDFGVQMNRESSRSHLIISIVVESTNLQTQNVTKGKLSFVDLAGSERCVPFGGELQVG